MSRTVPMMCSQCYNPGQVILDDDGHIERAFFLCSCPHPVSIAALNRELERQ